MPDKLTIVTLEARQFKSLAACLVLTLAISGCATPPRSDSHERADSSPGTASYTEAERLEEVSALLQQAEHSRLMGDQDSILDALLAAARIAEDSELTRQAVAMAWRMSAWSALVEAAELWRADAPQSDDARRLLALGLLNSGRSDEATALLGEWLLDAEDDARQEAPWRELTQLLAAAEDPEVADRVFDAVVQLAQLSPDDAAVLSARSRLNWQLDRPDMALDLALAAAQRSGSREHLVWAAQLSSAFDDYEQALTLYRQARALDPDDVVLGLSEAEALRQLDRIDEALRVLEQLEPTLDVLYSIASYSHLSDRPAEAREAWELMAAWAPIEDVNQHAFMVAWLAEILEMPEQAAAWYSRVRGGPNVDRALLRRAILLADADRIDEARQMLVLARDTEQRDLREQAWLIEAELLREAGRSTDAVGLLGEALREAPSSIPLLYSRAINAIEMDDLELAEQDLRRIIQIDADNAMALNALGYTLTDRTTRHAEAYRLIRRALELSPDEPAILDSMGWVYFRLGRPETALGYLEQALEGEDNPEIAAHLGEVLWSLDQSQRAREVLHAAWERHPEDRHLADTMERLELWP